MITIETEIGALKEYSDHLKSLSDADKHSRFGYMPSDYVIDQLIMNIVKNPTHHVLFRASEPSGETSGWGHMAKDEESYELAVSVEMRHQRKGVGSRLIGEMLEWAKFHNITQVYMHCIESNRVIQHLALKHNLVTRERGHGERTAALEIPEPSWFEKHAKFWKDQNHMLDEYTELNRRMTHLMFGKHTNTQRKI